MKEGNWFLPQVSGARGFERLAKISFGPTCTHLTVFGVVESRPDVMPRALHDPFYSLDSQFQRGDVARQILGHSSLCKWCRNAGPEGALPLIRAQRENK